MRAQESTVDRVLKSLPKLPDNMFTVGNVAELLGHQVPSTTALAATLIDQRNAFD
jgi:hypothetical protein